MPAPSSDARPVLVVITGPTASGKSALAVEVARRLGCEILSADSRQLFRDIPIGTAAPSPVELAAVPHHFVGCLGLGDYFSAARYEEEALRLLGQLWNRPGAPRVMVVCGGSMMYVDALCNGVDILPTIPDELRASLTAQHATNGDEWLLDRLRTLDPEYYAQVDRRNIRRVFHAVEIIMAAGQSYTSLRTGRVTERPFRILKICLEADRQTLFSRINMRVDAMVRDGLEQEARSVFHLRHLNSLNTVGLKEMFAYFDGMMDRDTAIERIKKNTRVYAKKQLTWFQRDTTVRWLHPSAPLSDFMP